MIFFLIIILIAAIAMGMFILIQNPKGGGLAGNIAGFNSQFMGVKQTTDVLEKGTWIMAVVIAILCLTSSFFIPKGTTGSKAAPLIKPNATQTAPASQPAVPGNAVPMPAPTK